MTWKEFESKFKKALTESAQRDVMLKTGIKASDIIRNRTRRGEGVNESGGERSKLSKLKPSTVKGRQYFGALSSQTQPNFSNLTRTGQMLNSISVIDAKPFVALVGFKTNRDDGKTNRDIAQYAEDGSSKQNRVPRRFFRLAGKEADQVFQFLRSEILRVLRRNGY